jgi:hypothetical protein
LQEAQAEDLLTQAEAAEQEAFGLELYLLSQKIFLLK